MATLNFNASNYTFDDNEGGGFDPIPEGYYRPVYHSPSTMLPSFQRNTRVFPLIPPHGSAIADSVAHSP